MSASKPYNIEEWRCGDSDVTGDPYYVYGESEGRAFATAFELERLRAELDQVKRERDAAHERANQWARDCDAARDDTSALEAKLKTAADAHPGCGLLDDLAGECRCAQREQHLRADNARLREAFATCGGNNHSPEWYGDGSGRCTTCGRNQAEDVALASTDPSPWLRDFGMKVAFALEGVPVTRERRDQIAAIVDGVMK